MAREEVSTDAELNSLLNQLISDTENTSDTELIQQCYEFHNFNSRILNYLQNHQAHTNDVYKWLFLWIKSYKSNLVNFAIQFLPSVIWNYLYSLYATPNSTNNQLKKLSEICIVALVPQLTNDERISIPNFTQVTAYSSVYHRTKKDLPLQQLSAPVGSTTNGSMQTPPTMYTQLPFSYSLQGPLKKINSSNRSSIILSTLNKFKQDISSYPIELKLAYCHMCTRICSAGFSGLPISKLLQSHLDSSRSSSNNQLITLVELQTLSSISRIQLNEKLLLEMNKGMRYCLEKPLFLSVLQAVEVIYQRANYHIYQSALITSNALLNLILDENSNEELSIPRHKVARHDTLVEEDLSPP